MAITRVGTSAAGDGTTITIPSGHQAGDLLIIYAFRGVLNTAPSLPAGWTSLGTQSSSASAYRVGWKIAGSSSETSGTWTNATGLAVDVYRGTATNKVPILIGTATVGSSATATYGNIFFTTDLQGWVVAFGAVVGTGTTLENVPTGLSLAVNTVGATCEYVGFDSNGAYTSGAGAYKSNTTALGSSVEWRTITIQILAEEGYNNNYQRIKTGDGVSNGEAMG